MFTIRTSATTSPQSYDFDILNFPSLTLQEFGETWNDIGLAKLPPDERGGLEGLLQSSGIASSPTFNPNKVLLVKADRGILKSVYGPAIFRNGDGIILKIGENATLVEQKGDRLTVGKLKGKITVIEREGSRLEKYPVAHCSFVDTAKNVYKVRISLEQSFSAGEIEAALLNEESMLPFLAQVPTPAVTMQSLGVGEYEVIAVSPYEGEHGLSYKLHLANGTTVWARGNSEVLLRSGYTKREGIPLTLVVASIEEFTPGKFKVDNALRERLPQIASAPIRTILTSAVEIPDDADENALGVDGQNLDKIPF
jgi:hypothetical protein